MNVVPMLCSDVRSIGSNVLPYPGPSRPDVDPDVIAAAQNDRCVLLTGAAAQASALALKIHNLSGWRWGPFVAVDCGGTEAVLERQLFDVLRIGPRGGTPEPRPRLRQSGTVFLHEVGKLGLTSQARLRVILESSLSKEADRVRQRVMASSSEPLVRRVLDGTFDEDLYCLLNAVRLHVGPVHHAV